LAGRNKAEARERLEPVAAALRRLWRQRLSERYIAAVLNDRGVPSPGGRKWHPSSVHGALQRLGLTTEARLQKLRTKARKLYVERASVGEIARRIGCSRALAEAMNDEFERAGVQRVDLEKLRGAFRAGLPKPAGPERKP
jgi:hypothetical protein